MIVKENKAGCCSCCTNKETRFCFDFSVLSIFISVWLRTEVTIVISVRIVCRILKIDTDDKNQVLTFAFLSFLLLLVSCPYFYRVLLLEYI